MLISGYGVISMLVSVLLLCMPSLLIQADPQVERIIQDLELDSGQPYFNAAYRAQYRTEEGQAGTLQCEEGSYCIKEWWNTGPTTNTTSTVQNCEYKSISCNHTCPEEPRQKPERKPLPLSGDNCGSSYKGDGQFEINSIGYSEDQECVDLTLLANYNGKVAVRLDYFIDKAKLRDSQFSRFMLLEGKLMAGDGASRANTPFYVTVQKVRTTYHLKLSLMMSPAVIYTEAVSSELKTNYAKLVIRHIPSAEGTSTCFYLTGVRWHCLTSDVALSIGFLSVMGVNNPNIPLFTGAITLMEMYEASPTHTLTERDVMRLAQLPSPLTPEPSCVCSSDRYPLNSRSDWPAFGPGGMPGQSCYQANEGAAQPRYNVDAHPFTAAFDGNLLTEWMTSSASQTTIIIQFPTAVSVVGFSLALITLPISMTIAIKDREFRFESDCGSNANCETWDQFILSNTSGSSPPLLSWKLPSADTSSAVTFIFSGNLGDGQFQVISEIIVVATCVCSGQGQCLVNRNYTENSHQCGCTTPYSGPQCDQCEDGFYKYNDTCQECRCNALGTCSLLSEGCVSEQKSCDKDGYCSCRAGNAFLMNQTNQHCVPSVHNMAPTHGPIAGGTMVTITGSYIAGYDSVVIENQDGERVIRQASVSQHDAGSESLRFLTPSSIGVAEVSISLQSRTEGNTYILPLKKEGFLYAPNPTVTRSELKSMTKSGGQKLVFYGSHLNSTATPVLQTHVHCNNKPPFHTVESDCTVLSAEAVMCYSASLVEIVATSLCKRQRRSVNFELSNLQVTYGVRFDGFLQYATPNESVRYPVLNDPMLSAFDNGTRMSNFDAETLELDGKNLLCCEESYYRVLVGDSVCETTIITKSSITCKLPEEFTAADIGAAMEVQVTLGPHGESILLGELVKSSISKIWEDGAFLLAVIISVCLTFVIILMMCVSVCCYYKLCCQSVNLGTSKISLQELYNKGSPKTTLEKGKRNPNYSVRTAPRDSYNLQLRSYNSYDDEWSSPVIRPSDPPSLAPPEPSTGSDSYRQGVYNNGGDLYDDRSYNRRYERDGYGNGGFYEIEI